MTVWRLARPLQDLNVLLLEPLLYCLGRVLWVIPIFNALSIVPLSCPLSRKTPPKHNVFTSMFDGVLGVIDSIPPPHTANWVDAKELGFGLIWPQHSPSSPLNHWLTSDRPVHVLSWAAGPCGHCRISVLHGVVFYQLFSWWLWSKVPWDPCSSGLIPLRSHDHWNSTRRDLAWSPSPREIDSYLVFLPFANNHTNCCHLLTKLLGDGLVAHSSLVYRY